MKTSFALEAIEKNGMLLVYPIDNAKDPASLWSVAYPRSKMSWEWDESGDNRVANLWHLRAELSISRKVIYTKWYRGRATFFSLKTFQAMLALSLQQNWAPLSRQARKLLALLEERSPLSPKQLKRETDLVGRALEPLYQKALKELWLRFLIVGYGEIDEGSFPSLALGSTRALFEDLYLAAAEMEGKEAKKIVEATLALSPKVTKFYQQCLPQAPALPRSGLTKRARDAGSPKRA